MDLVTEGVAPPQGRSFQLNAGGVVEFPRHVRPFYQNGLWRSIWHDSLISMVAGFFFHLNRYASNMRHSEYRFSNNVNQSKKHQLAPGSIHNHYESFAYRGVVPPAHLVQPLLF